MAVDIIIMPPTYCEVPVRQLPFPSFRWFHVKFCEGLDPEAISSVSETPRWVVAVAASGYCGLDSDYVASQAAHEGRQWDVIVLDPPKLAPSRKSLPQAASKCDCSQWY